MNLEKTQGKVKFLTGGKPREAMSLNRCNSGGDSTVWMEELKSFIRFLGVFLESPFLWGKRRNQT